MRSYVKLEIRSVERGICPIAESIMTDSVIFNAHVRNCLISTSRLWRHAGVGEFAEKMSRRHRVPRPQFYI